MRRIIVVVSLLAAVFSVGFAFAADPKTVPYDVTGLLKKVSQAQTQPTTVDLTNLENPPASMHVAPARKKVRPRVVVKDAPALTEETRYVVVGGRIITIAPRKVEKGDTVSAYAKAYEKAIGTALKNPPVYIAKVKESNPQLMDVNRIAAGRTVNVPVVDTEIGEPTLASAVAALKKVKELELKLEQQSKQMEALEQHLREKSGLVSELERALTQERHALQKSEADKARLTTEIADLKNDVETAEQDKTALNKAVESLTEQRDQQVKINADISESIKNLTASNERTTNSMNILLAKVQGLEEKIAQLGQNNPGNPDKGSVGNTARPNPGDPHFIGPLPRQNHKG